MRPSATFRFLTSPVLPALITLASLNARVFAEPVYWGQTAYSSDSTYEGSVASAENWFADAAGTSSAAAAPDSLDDDLVFNTTPADTVGGNVNITANFSANSITFNTSGTTVLAQDANRTVIVGAGGITLNADSGNVTFGINTNLLVLRLAASQTWANHSANNLSVRNVTTNPGAGPVILTLSANGAGNITIPLSIADTVDDPLSVAIDSAGSGAVTMMASKYSGGTTIKRGKLNTSGSVDTGAIQIGDTTGAFDAMLTVNSTGFPNNLVVPSGGSGSKTLVTTNPAGMLSGAITLDNTLSVSGLGKLTTLSGAISGTGALLKTGKGELALAGQNTFSGNVTVDAGSLTLTEAGSLTFHLGDNGAGNQLNGSGSAAFHGTFHFKLPATPLVDGNAWQIVTVSNKSYGPTFAIAGFTQTDDVWTNGTGLTFSESTGVLTYKR